MFYIVVYDVAQERVNKVCSLLRRYLNWIQNSVFEGEMNEADELRMESELKEVIDKNIDSIIIYKVRFENEIQRRTIGVQKSETSRFI